jgi:hypothetical protein
MVGAMAASLEHKRARWPLSGELRIQFVDGADPDDPSLPPNWGGGIGECQPQSWINDPRLPSLLRWLADWIEDDLAQQGEAI